MGIGLVSGIEIFIIAQLEIGVANGSGFKIRSILLSNSRQTSEKAILQQLLIFPPCGQAIRSLLQGCTSQYFKAFLHQRKAFTTSSFQEIFRPRETRRPLAFDEDEKALVH